MPAMDAAPTPKTPDEPEDDGLGELQPLPPLDGETEEESPDEELDAVDDPDETEKNLLDDATGEGEPVDDLEQVGAEGGWLDDAADAEDLDVGGHEVDDLERTNLLEDADEPGVGDEDFGLEGHGTAVAGDAGEEGPEGADEELREEDLPRLDADEDGELDDEVFVDAWPATGGADERPPWDDRAWERAPGSPSVGMARSVVTIDARVAVVGGASIVLAEEGSATPAGGTSIHGFAIAGVARLSDAVVAATAGGLFSSDLAGTASGLGEFRELRGWTALSAGAPVEIAAHGARIWARTKEGAVFASGDRGETWGVLAAEGISAVTVTPEGELVAVARAGVVRGPQLVSWGPPLPLAEGALATVRARGHAVVVGAFGAGAFRSTGGEWERLAGTGSVTALTLLDDDGTTLVALQATDEERSWIARAGSDGVARIVVELGGEGGDDGDPRVLDLAWRDDARIAWAVGAFGVAVLRPR